MSIKLYTVDPMTSLPCIPAKVTVKSANRDAKLVAFIMAQHANCSASDKGWKEMARVLALTTSIKSGHATPNWYAHIQVPSILRIRHLPLDHTDL
jgi:hypothetical protein